jgi:hypothetical protein
MTPPAAQRLPGHERLRPIACHGGLLALLLLSAITIVPIWSFKYFPTTDGGAHVANADVLLQYGRPAGAMYRQYYELTPLPLPNSLGHFVLALLMAVLPPLVAEKVFISSYLILLPLAVRYAARSVKRSSGWVAMLAIPLSLNWIFHQGFYNFLISVAIFFFLFGYWLRHREAMHLKRAAILGALGLLLYAGHLLSITVACAAIFILATSFTLSQAFLFHRRGILSWHRIWPGIYSRFVLSFAALLPAIGLVVWFQRRGFAGKPGKTKLAIFDPAFWKNLGGLSILVSYRQQYERPLALCIAAILIALLLVAIFKKFTRRQWRRMDLVLLIPAAFCGLYFTRGDFNSGQLFIPQRLVFYAYLTALLFVAAQPVAQWVKFGAAVASFALVAALTAAHWPAYREYNVQLGEFLATAERMDEQSTMLPIIFAPGGEPGIVDADGLRSRAFYSAAGYAAVSRHSVDLRNYEAGLDYFPVRFKPDANPYKHLAVMRGKQNGLEMVPQVVNLRRYRGHGEAQFVVIWAPDADFPGEPPEARARKVADKEALLAQLRADYKLTYTSPTGRAQLWRLAGGAEHRTGGTD